MPKNNTQTPIKEKRNFTRFIGIDPGTNKTGICICKTGETPHISVIQAEFPKASIDMRITSITHQVLDLIKGAPTALVVIENPFGIMGNGRQLLELVGILKYTLTEMGHRVYTVPQTTIKKFATNSGRAEKSDMVLKAFKEFQIDGAGEDGVDAFWMCKFGEALKVASGVSYRDEVASAYCKKHGINL